MTQQPITYIDLWAGVVREHNTRRDGLRLGQRLFNRLVEANPHLAEQLRGSAHDPFYRAVVDQEIHDWIIEHWEAPPAP